VAFTILLADDSMTAQNMGKKILTEAGYEVITVSNGAAAVKKIAERRPDLAVLDVYMPGYTGVEVCERVKNALETTRMPVILTVGKMEHFKAEEGARVKADGVIIKPFEASELLAAIQKLQQKLNPQMAAVVATKSSHDETPEYERTIQIAAPVPALDKDESYQTWKSEAEEHVDEQFPPTRIPTAETPAPVEISTPAFADELVAEPPVQQPRSTASMQAKTAELTTDQVGAHSDWRDAIEDTAAEQKPASKNWFGGASALGDLEELPAASPAALHEESALQSSSPNVAAGEEGPEDLPSLSAYESAATESAIPESLHEFHRLESFGASAVPAGEEAAQSWAQEPALSSPEIPPELPTGAPFDPAAHAVAKPAARTTEPSLEFASAPAAEISLHDAPPAPGFEPTSLRLDTADVAAGAQQDSDLVTDVSEMSAAFPTRFGVENPEPVPVGDASQFPELYGNPPAEPPPVAAHPRGDTQPIEPLPTAEVLAPTAELNMSDHEFDARVAAAMQTSWVAEEAPLQAHETGVLLHEELRQRFADAVQPSTESEPVSAPMAALHAVAEAEGSAATPASLAPVAAENTPDPVFAAAMAAAMGLETPPAAATKPEEPAPQAPAEESAVPAGIEPQLAEAMASAIGAEVVPSVSQAVVQSVAGDPHASEAQSAEMITQIVTRITERIKPDLIAEITREIAAEIARKKK
jgi:CheY-like chemotaxis protein